jgi:hypothetical protein
MGKWSKQWGRGLLAVDRESGRRTQLCLGKAICTTALSSGRSSVNTNYCNEGQVAVVVVVLVVAAVLAVDRDAERSCALARRFVQLHFLVVVAQ